MKFRVDVDGEAFMLDMESNGLCTAYTLRGDAEQGGNASVEEVTQGVFSVLLEDRSLQVYLAPHPQGLEVWVGLDRYVISLADSRDRIGNLQKDNAEGPVELRAQMPGKIIKVLAPAGSDVTAGQGLVVVEAMKMQNEVKAPKSGTIKCVSVAEGETVSAGDVLLVVE